MSQRRQTNETNQNDQTWQLNKKRRPGRREEDVCGLTGTRLRPLITVASPYTGCFPPGLISGRRCLPRGEGNEKWLSWEMLYMNSVSLTFKTLTSCFSCSSQKQWSWQFDAENKRRLYCILTGNCPNAAGAWRSLVVTGEKKTFASLRDTKVGFQGENVEQHCAGFTFSWSPGCWSREALKKFTQSAA